MAGQGGLRIEYVAEVVVRLRDGGRRRGSGYLVASGAVLTAAHVVAGAAEIRVRFDADRPGERQADVSVAWAHAGIDVAVLAVPQEKAEHARAGRIGEADAVLRCSAVGFPEFKMRTDEASWHYRDSEHVHATCAVLANRREGTLDLSVTPPSSPDPGVSPWQGMSGAAVFSGGFLVGVVAEHHLADGPGRLAASRVDRWAERLGADEVRELEALLGFAVRPEGLAGVLPVSEAGLTEAAYRAQLADVAPEGLEDRQEERALLVDFCAGSERYLWIQGPPWAGKTALVSSFALDPPRGVVPVWFFVTNRRAEQADATACTEALVHQLSLLAGRPPAGLTSGAARDGERRQLLHEAAGRLSAVDAVLLLVVDGLDEDEALRADGRGPSIASLLPERLPDNVRVLVTSRPRPDLPSDVKGGHPLRSCRVHELRSVAAARHTEHEARYDLTSALTGDRLGRDLVGLLAAARGSLTADDMRELSETTQYDLKRRLGSAFGRILRVGAGDSSGILYDSLGRRGLLFAHETLFATAVDELGPDLDVFRARVHAWARDYAARGWPTETPGYLLHAYSRLTVSLGDIARATALALDARRHERLREVTGSDTAAVAELDLVREMVRERAPEDLGTQAALSAARDLVARRNMSLHPGLPVATARLGRWERAVGMARSIFEPELRAQALVRIAQFAAGAGDRLRVVSLVGEAVPLAVHAAEQDPWCPQGLAENVIRAGAVALMTVGADRAALELLGEFDPEAAGPRGDSWYGRLRVTVADDPVAWVRTLTEVARAAWSRDDAGARALLREAEEAARQLRGAAAVSALAAVAEAYTEGGDTGAVARLCDRIEGLVGESPAVSLLAAGAVALSAARPARARELAVRARARAAESVDLLLTASPGRLPASFDSLTAVGGAVVALARTGDMRGAEELLTDMRRQLADASVAVDLLFQSAEGILAIAAHHVAEGRAATALRWLLSLWDALPPIGFALTEVFTSLAAVPERDGQWERVLLELAEAKSAWPMVEVLAARAERLAVQEPAAAAELVCEAERWSAREGRTDRGRDERLGELAVALATAGDPLGSESILRCVDEEHVRTAATALVASALAESHPAQAANLARDAAHTWLALEGPGPCEPVMEALWRTGEGSWARDMADVVHPSAYVPLAWVADDEDAAPDVTALAETYVLDALQNPDRPTAVIELADLLGALRGHDPAHTSALADALTTAVLSPQMSHRSQLPLLSCLLAHPTDPEESDRWMIEALDRVKGPAEPADLDEDAAFALTLAALGRYGDAVHTAAAFLEEPERAEAFGLLAAHLVQARQAPLATLTRIQAPYFLPVIWRLASLSPPRDPEDAGARARDLVAETLATGHWHHALPALAVLDPAAVRQVRDVVLAHLRLPTA
ncbi:trypsin-like peptidase domain-containing protein [Streptomyces sp. NPDC005485]|uniref:trypsin-like peptidase domain-containing protein n=1 Tax=Streptomyces sp. NPDC005485 TaxID=3155591 RepID=UPI0033B40CE1